MLGKLLILASLALAAGRPQVGSNEASAHDLCPDDEIHHLLPHEYDCTKFYYCEYGVKWETPRDCAPGTEFSYQLQVCIHPAQANCTLPGVPPPVEEIPVEPELVEPEVEESEEKEPETDVEEPEVEAPDATEPETDEEEKEVDPPDVTEPETDVEEPEVEAPDEPEQEPDVEEPEVEESDETETDVEEQEVDPPVVTTPEPDVEEPEVDVQPETEENATEWLDNGCPADFHVHWLLPHESDCGKFYYCVFGKKEERSCSGGLHFNPELQVCDWPENVGCANAVEPEAVDPEVEEPEVVDPDSNSDEENATEWLDNGCPADFHVHWLLPHESDCGKFYYCVFGEKEERSCSGGLHFNPELQVCDWPENVGCANSGEPEAVNPEVEEPETVDPGTVDPDSNSDEENATEWLDNGCPADFHVHWLLPHESDCGKFYYCVFWEKEERSCSGGLHFNPELQVCDWPENVGCAAAGEPEVVDPEVEDPEAVDPEVEEPEVVEPGTVEPESNSGEENATEWLANGCPADFHVHWLLPHESDCGKFYYCVFGEKEERSCSGGLYFNPELQVCDWPENVGCAAAGKPEEVDPEVEEPETVEPGTVDPESNSGEENATEWLDNGCPADFHVHWLLPHESDCGKFYYCVFGEKEERSCGGGLHFNPELQVCDWPENVGCANAVEPEAVDPEVEEPEVVDPDSNSDEENATEWLDNGCPADFHVHWLLPHESDCGKFYYCVFGEKEERSCSGGLHFNPELQVCDWPENVGCANAGEPEVVDQEEEFEIGPVCDWPENVSCAAAGEPEVVDPEVEDPEAVDPEVEEPEVVEPGTVEPESNSGEENATEWLDNGCPADFHVHWLLPHESDCGKFYYCVFGEKEERSCSGVLHFNPELQVCDWPENVGCAAAGAPGAVDPEVEEPEIIDPEVEEPEVVDPESNSGEENATEWLDNGCPADFHVHWLLPHESDCGKFYYCVFGEKEERSCGIGLHFNPELQVCDWPENVGCANAGEPEAVDPEVEEPEVVEPESNSGEENATEWLDNGCPADFHVHWLLPHESDCGKFYYCVFGETEERSCSGGLHFNPELQVCDWPENVGCAAAGAPGAVDPEVEEPEIVDPEVEEPEVVDPEVEEPEVVDPEEEEPEVVDPESNSGEENATEWLDNGCPADFHVHWLLPHESDCGKFYYCVFGEKEERSCSGGLHFNPELQVCDWPENVGCAAGAPGAVDPEVEEPEVVDPEVEEPEVVDPESNSGEESATEWLDNGCPADFHVHWLLPHESDCGKFYYCVFGEKEESSCSGGLHFNPVLQVCDWPENAGCANAGEPEAVDPEVEEPEVEEPEVVDPEVVDPEVEEPEVDNRCVDTCNIKPWAHNTDCDKYWRCEEDKPLLIICSEGLQFNDKTGSCDYSCNSGCVRDHVQTTASQEGLKIFVPWQQVNDNMRKTLSMI